MRFTPFVFFKSNFFHEGNSANSTKEENAEFIAERLKGRSVLLITGADAEAFLEDLTTNDVRKLSVNPSMYTLFLNGRGKVIHDAIIYRRKDKSGFYVECDISSIEALQVHMVMYRAKKRVDIKSVEHKLSTWAVYSPKEVEQFIKKCKDVEDFSDIHPYYEEPSKLDDLELEDDVIISRDPRVFCLGLRMLAPKDLNILGVIRGQGMDIKASPNTYKTMRYKLGIGEGSLEVGYGRCTPAEVNGDFLNGIDYNKASYIGYTQEVKKTAVDSRLMPIMFNTNTANQIPVNTPIEDARGRKKSPVGYLKGLQGLLGLALMNVTGSLQYKNVKIGRSLMKVIKPPWWKD